MRSSIATATATIYSLCFVAVLFSSAPLAAEAANTINFGSGSCSGCSDPGHFCGIDGTCHPFSCQTYYQYADRKLTGYADNSTFQCFGYSKGDQENAHGVIYGCDPLFPFTKTTPGKQVSEPFNRKCTAEREGGYSFECYEFMPSETATDFTFFEREAESSFPDCGDGKSPKYWYMIASSNHYVGFEGLQGNPILARGADIDGDTIWSTNPGNTFKREIALTSMYANVVGGPSPPSDTTPIQAGSLGGSNPLKNPRPDHERTGPVSGAVAVRLAAVLGLAVAGFFFQVL